jgi:hypothetical protein
MNSLIVGVAFEEAILVKATQEGKTIPLRTGVAKTDDVFENYDSIGKRQAR